MGLTSIEWATHTANFQAGCSKVSPACANCYALTLSVRMANMGGPARYSGATNGDLRRPAWTGKITADLPALHRIFQGLRGARKPRRVFLNSMTDTFHKDAPPDALDALAEEIKATTNNTHVTHQLLLLTKRPEGLLSWQQAHFPAGLPAWVWCGVTVEDQRRADERVPVLLKVQAAVRYLSMEPLLGPVDLTFTYEGVTRINALTGNAEGPKIHWVIAGGESGTGARPSHPGWYRSLRDQCQATGVPFLFKQWGAWGYPDRREDCGAEVIGMYANGHHEPRADLSCAWGDVEMLSRVGKKKAGRVLDGRTWDEVP